MTKATAKPKYPKIELRVSEDDKELYKAAAKLDGFTYGDSGNPSGWLKSLAKQRIDALKAEGKLPTE